jgi:DNA-directed RNA polymerase subunit RPC12/RpoP
MEDKNPSYVICLKCKKRIDIDKLEFVDKTSKVTCPHCNCKMSYTIEGPLTETKILKLIGEE